MLLLVCSCGISPRSPPDVLGGQSPLDLSDITGQEDPLILHSIIATTRAVQAHREGETTMELGELYRHTVQNNVAFFKNFYLSPFAHISIFSPPPVVVVVDLHIFYSLPLSLPLPLSAVHKFRRRPQYLEFFVHLASAGMEQGLHHLVPEWAHETFTWLARQVNVSSTKYSVCSFFFYTAIHACP